MDLKLIFLLTIILPSSVQSQLQLSWTESASISSYTATQPATGQVNSNKWGISSQSHSKSTSKEEDLMEDNLTGRRPKGP